MNMPKQLILLVHLLCLLVPVLLITGDPDCCDTPAQCMNPECSCCSEDRYQICKTQGKTGCEDNCKPGYHGHRCYNKCPNHCLTCRDWDKGYSRICLTCNEGYHVANRRCVPDSCPETCLQCRNETHCSKCVPGHKNGKDPVTSIYYSDCRLTCPEHCTDCNSQDNCLRCEYGYFGIKCTSVCRHSCNVDVCFHNGTCRCKEGFYGATCDTCLNCTIACSKKCFNNVCDMTGRCINGCLGNFQEPYCTRCTPNFKGETCELCASGRYGENCTKTCPNRCVTCNQQTSLCEECDGNFMGNTCEECKVGFHGKFCTDVCPSTCVDNICIRSNGTCTNGCISEYSGDMCCLNKSNCKTCLLSSTCLQCNDGFYGKQCHLKCPLNCISCHRLTGECYDCNGNYSGGNCQECSSGYFGEACNFTCSKGCKTGRSTAKCIHGSCHQDSGSCLHGCIDGFSGERCDTRESHENSVPMDQPLFIGLIVTIVLLVAAFIFVLIVLIKRERDDRDMPEYENQSKGKSISNLSILKKGKTSIITDYLRNNKKQISVTLEKIKRDNEVIEIQLTENVPMDNNGDGEDKTYEQLGSGNEHSYANLVVK